jgi:uncharacterized membrane protein
MERGELAIHLMMFTWVGVLIMLLSWPMIRGRVGQNPVYGLRTPATFKDPVVWAEANRRAGKELFAVGALVLVMTYALLAVPGLRGRHPAILVSVLVVGVLVVAVRGWRLANRLLRERGVRDPSGTTSNDRGSDV